MLTSFDTPTTSDNRRIGTPGIRLLMIPTVVLMAFSLCSCKARQAARVDPFLNDARVSHAKKSSSQLAKSDAFVEEKNRSSSAESTRSLAEQSTPTGRVRLSGNATIPATPIIPSTVIPPTVSPRVGNDFSWAAGASSTASVSPKVNTVAFTPPTQTFSGSETPPGDSAVSFTPAEPRVPLWGVDQQEPDFSAEQQSEEYLFDGGDRDHPVHYDGQNRLGLDTEDTIAEYSDHTGKQHVKASNRVAIYAPRFGSVRSISQPTTGVSVDKLASALESRRTSALDNQTGTVDQVQRNSMQGLRVRSRVSGVETESQQSGVEQRTSAAEATKLNNVYENLTFLRSGQFIEAERARISYGRDAAEIWSKNLSPVISGSTSAGQEVYATSQQQEFVVVEERPGQKGRLRIVKLADKKLAHPGDTITFTIRFDNTGQRDLHGIRIVDNLSPRLQYVEDSATSDRAGRLVVEDNQEGSLVLKFEVSEPLPGGEGGVVTFQTKVR